MASNSSNYSSGIFSKKGVATIPTSQLSVTVSDPDVRAGTVVLAISQNSLYAVKSVIASNGSFVIQIDTTAAGNVSVGWVY